MQGLRGLGLLESEFRYSGISGDDDDVVGM
jgi:hypothetical protein